MSVEAHRKTDPSKPVSDRKFRMQHGLDELDFLMLMEGPPDDGGGEYPRDKWNNIELNNTL
jgi:hypothetical protein